MATRAAQILRKLLDHKKLSSSLDEVTFCFSEDDLNEAIDAIYRLTELER